MDKIQNSEAQIITLKRVKKLRFADGQNIGGPLSDTDKNKMIKKAAKKFGEFLDALGCDWKNDPNSLDTPKD